MEVQAQNLKMSQILKKGKFIIPDYQREYDWLVDEEISEFLSDLDDSDEGESYFIGHMVFEGVFNGTNFIVIDGQQRFTTITILLCAIRDRFYELSEEDLAKGINENYIFGTDDRNRKFVILENKMPYPLLQKTVQNIPQDKEDVQPLNPGEANIKDAYFSLKESLQEKSTSELEMLRDKVLNLEAIFVAVSNQNDAIEIFQTLNAKGKDLSPLDLMKSKIFQGYISLPHIDEPNDSWKQLMLNIGPVKLKFLNDFWSSRYKKVSDVKIYKAFIKVSEVTGFSFNQLLDNLVKDSFYYHFITDPSVSDWGNDEYDIFLSLYGIKLFNIRVANSILLSLLREYKLGNVSKEYLNKGLNSICRFHFINNAVSSLRSSGLDTMYARVAKKLFNAANRHEKHNVIDDLIGVLGEKIIGLRDIYNASFEKRLYFEDSDTVNKKLVNYLLSRIEYKNQSGNVLLLNMSLEHICPERDPNNQWLDFGDRKYISSIGNIVLLDRELNSDIKSKNYLLKKQAILENSTLISTNQTISSSNIWNEDVVKSRISFLKDYLFNDLWLL